MTLNPIKILNNMIDKRIKNYSKGVGTMQYNPLLVLEEMTDNLSDRHFTRRVLENSVWYSGIEQDIAYFYTKQAPKFYRKGQASESLHYFWANNETDIRKIHSGFPQLISEKMVDLLVGNGYKITVEGVDETELQDYLDNILKDNKFKGYLMNKSIETESWAGGFAWKMSWNPELTEYPIIEMWQPENYTFNILNSRVREDIFYTYYDKGNSKYRLSEIYGVDKEGSYIDYKLEELLQGHWELASLKDLPQTYNLKRVVFKGYYKRLSMYKPNKLPNSEFRYTQLGESDYAGSYGAFDAIDEILSTWIQEFRDGKLHRYFPEEMMISTSSGDYQYPAGFKKDHILTADSPSENMDKEKIQYSQGDIRADKHIESYKVWATQVLNNAGLSPLTVGITGLESIDASAQSQQEREKVSIRTRNKKAELWKEFLEEYMQVVLEFYLMTKNMVKSPNETYSVGKLPEFEIKVTFNDYILKSRADRTEEVRNGMGTGWDVLTGVKYIHEDKTEREQLAISAKIKLENNFNSISEPELAALQEENAENAE